MQTCVKYLLFKRFYLTFFLLRKTFVSIYIIIFMYCNSILKYSISNKEFKLLIININFVGYYYTQSWDLYLNSIILRFLLNCVFFCVYKEIKSKKIFVNIK